MMVTTLQSPLDCLNQVDLCFIVDTTGSMGPFLEEAKRHLRATVERLQEESSLDLAVGLVEYRDHPPQERSFVYRISPLTKDIAFCQRAINAMKADGGGDAPEAVFDGIEAACKQIKWRPYSRRLAVLVGDAPPQGATAHQGRGAACRCGLTLHNVASLAEATGITLFAIPVGRDRMTREAFGELALLTGGTMSEASNASEVLEKMTILLREDFQNLSWDGKVLTTALHLGNLDTQSIADALCETRSAVAVALARLGRRGLLNSLLRA